MSQGGFVHRVRLTLQMLLAWHSAEQQEKKAQLAAVEEQQRQKDAGAGKTTSQSQKLMARLKTRRFAQIFQYLDQVSFTPSLSCLLMLLDPVSPASGPT
jgi:hypothetical protein